MKTTLFRNHKPKYLLSLYQYSGLFGTVFLSATYTTTIKSLFQKTLTPSDCVTNLHTCRQVFMVCRFGTQAVMGLLSLWKQCSSQTTNQSTSYLYQYSTLFGTIFLSATYRTTIKSLFQKTLTPSQIV